MSVADPPDEIYCRTHKKREPRENFYKASANTWNHGYQQHCKESQNKKTNAARAKARELNKHLTKTYGLDPDEYDYMRIKQKFRCAICKKKKKLVVDHCHDTRRVRGLLCGTCNAGLGMFKDNKEFLSNAIYYLDKV